MDEKPAKWTPRVRGSTFGITQVAQQMREDMTSCESILWEQLRRHRLGGLKFRRQHAVGRYILDFYCPQAKLAVEVDGEVHEGRVEYDAERTSEIEQFGYTVVRIKNADVLSRLPAVLEEIERTAKQLISEQSARSDAS